LIVKKLIKNIDSKKKMIKNIGSKKVIQNTDRKKSVRDIIY